MKLGKTFRKIIAVLIAVMVVASVCAGAIAASATTTVTLDFENSKGIACKNSGAAPSASYTADPENPDNTVYHFSDGASGYGWRGSAMFGADSDATTRGDGFLLEGGKTYTVSFKVKIGAGTTWDRVTDGPNAPEFNYRNYIRLSGITNSYVLGGSQFFGKEIKPANYEGVEDTLQQIYMSEQLPDQWASALEDINWDEPNREGDYEPYYIIKNEEDTPWIDYSTTFTCPAELDGAKLGMTLYVGVGKIDGVDQSWSCNFYLDDVVIETNSTNIGGSGSGEGEGEGSGSGEGSGEGEGDSNVAPDVTGNIVYPTNGKTATYTYNFRNYDAYDYMLGTENGFRVLGYGGTTDFTNPETTTSLDFWNVSSGPTPYGMIVGGSTDFFKDTGYTDAHGKLDIRGNNGGDALNFYGGNGVVVKEGYVYEVSIKFVPLNLTQMYKATKVAIALVQDTETVSARPIGTDYPSKGVYYAHLSLRGKAEWLMTEKSNVYRYDESLQGKQIGIDEFGYPVYENGIYLPTDPEISWFDMCEQTLTATYQYGATDGIGGKVITDDLGAHFGILVGSQGATIGESQRYFSQVCVTEVSIKVTAPADSTDFEDGAVFQNGLALGEKPEVEVPDTPANGDSSNMVLWTTLLLASGFGIITTSIYSRKRKYNR